MIEHLNESTIKQLISHGIKHFCVNRHTLLHAITPLVQHAKHNPSITVTWDHKLQISGPVSDVVAQAMPADSEIILAKNAMLSIDALTAKQRFLITDDTPASLLTGVHKQHVFVLPETVFSQFGITKRTARLKELLTDTNIALAHLVATNCSPIETKSGMRLIIGIRCGLNDRIYATMVISKETPPDLLPCTHNVPSVELMDIEASNISLLPKRIYKVSEYIQPSVLELLKGFFIQPSLHIQAIKAPDAETMHAIDLYHVHSKKKEVSTRITRIYGTLTQLDDNSLCITLEGPKRKRQCPQKRTSTHIATEANDPPIKHEIYDAPSKQETSDADASTHRMSVQMDHAEHTEKSPSLSSNHVVKNQKASTPSKHKHPQSKPIKTSPQCAGSPSIDSSLNTQLAGGSTPTPSTTTHASLIPSAGFFQTTRKQEITQVKLEI